MAIDYYGIQEALANLIQANVPAFHSVFVEAMDSELILNNMPLANIRMPLADRSITSLPNTYYINANYEVDIIAYDFTNFREAARLRDSLLNSVEDVIKANPHFFVGMETASLVPTIRFGALTAEGAGGHVALATFGVRAEIYYD